MHLWNRPHNKRENQLLASGNTRQARIVGEEISALNP
jgi:hypothetical protein